MPLEAPPHSATARAAALTSRHGHADAAALLDAALTAPEAGRLAVVSSFGAESAVLLHLVAQRDRSLPVLFIDTEMLFPETLTYQADLAANLGLTDIRIIRVSEAAKAARDPDGQLHKTDPDACCALRKSAPLQAALAGFDGWITGRKRYQGGVRESLAPFEADPGTDRIKINPLAAWRAEDARAYMDRHALPRHPLVARGFGSIGCMPCTTPVRPGEDPRAGRWRGQDKTECGIHFENGTLVRPNVEGEAA